MGSEIPENLKPAYERCIDVLAYGQCADPDRWKQEMRYIEQISTLETALKEKEQQLQALAELMTNNVAAAVHRGDDLEAQLTEAREQIERLQKPVKDETKYWAIVGYYTQDIIGVCTDQNDVLCEEPKSTFIEISEADYESYGDDWDRAKRDAVLASRAQSRQEQP